MGAPPSIYSNAADMAMRGGMGKGKAPLPPGAPPMPDAGAGGVGGGEEKKQIVTTLTSVLKKWEALEKDPKGKEIIQQMVDAVNQYQTEVLKEPGPDKAMGDKSANPEGAEPPPDPMAKGGGKEKVPA